VLAPQFLGRGKARSSAADDDNFPQHGGRAMAGAPRMPEQLLLGAIGMAAAVRR
jgi:hypothetical protein